MLTKFRSYQIAKELYLEVKKLPLRGEMKDQLHRASLSICLNLSEGAGKRTRKERARFFTIAFASTREVQALLDLESITALQAQADHLAACIWKLKQNPGSMPGL